MINKPIAEVKITPDFTVRDAELVLNGFGCDLICDADADRYFLVRKDRRAHHECNSGRN